MNWIESPRPWSAYKQDGTPIQGRAIPEGLAKGRNRKLLALEPPFILGPSPFEVSHLQPAQGPAHPDLRIVRLDLQRSLIRRHRFGQLSLRAKRISQVVVSVEVGWIELEARR